MSYLIVANWKMYLNHNRVSTILNETDFSVFENHELVLCPSFDSLMQVKECIVKSTIKLGAQDCSNFLTGAYTGQVSAQSLKEIGCSYCIVGHSETRQFFKLTDSDIAEKVTQLLQQNIIPIVCIGETAQEYAQQETINVLEKQLKPIISLEKNVQLCIAYEPVWSIGAGIIPPVEHLQMVYHYLQKKWNTNERVRFVYGGSINEKTIQIVKLIPEIRGFLIGKASTDFQELKNIVLSI